MSTAISHSVCCFNDKWDGNVKLGSRTHLCRGSHERGMKPLGRIVNLYVHRRGKWVKVGKICANCADLWINGKAYTAVRCNGKKTKQPACTLR